MSYDYVHITEEMYMKAHPKSKYTRSRKQHPNRNGIALYKLRYVNCQLNKFQRLK